jgi:hypothetical protein
MVTDEAGGCQIALAQENARSGAKRLLKEETHLAVARLLGRMGDGSITGMPMDRFLV